MNDFIRQIEDVTDLIRWRSEIANKRSICFVPTMGALHKGHLSLVDRALELGDIVVVSIFINPLQFGVDEDFEKYTRTLRLDLALLEEKGVDIVFTPDSTSIYLEDHQTIVNNSKNSAVLCGKSRENHFSGVLTIVLKLFNIVRPQFAIFGEKDFQQLYLIQRMVKDLNVAVKIIAVPTCRDKSGLALSSRNARLSAVGKESAAMVYKAMQEVRSLVEERDSDASFLLSDFENKIKSNKFLKIEYVQIRDIKTLKIIKNKISQPAIMLCAFWCEEVRLIDNIKLNES